MDTLLLGNGVNKYLEAEVLSWKELIREVWQEVLGETAPTFPAGLGYLEVMELLLYQMHEPRKRRDAKSRIKNGIRRVMLDWSRQMDLFQPERVAVVRALGRRYANIITTNYDRILPDFLGRSDATFVHKKKTDAGDLGYFTHHYPWTGYFPYACDHGPGKIWHIHGTIDLVDSICITVTDYYGAIERANTRLNARYKAGDASSRLYYEQSLFRPFLEGNLLIAGLTLNSNELFLRWLLFYKARRRQGRVCYCYVKQQGRKEGIPRDVEFLFTQLGYEFREYADHDALYRGLVEFEWNDAVGS